MPTLIRNSDAAPLESMKEQFPKQFRFGIVLYRGEKILPLSAHAVAVPLGAFFGDQA
jgi:hypothetical protein